MSGEILVIVSCPESIAESIAQPLVEEKLAACVSIMSGVKSIYFWDNKICKDSECILLIKTNGLKFNALEERVKALHTYDVPEIIAISIERGYPPYLDWLNKTVSIPMV